MMTCVSLTQRRATLLLALALCSPSCFHVQAQQSHDHYKVPFLEGDPNFLFLGNSYTNANNLPELLRHLLEAGVPEWDGRVEYQRRDPGGERLSGHLQQANGSRGNKVLLRQWLVNQDTRIQFKWVILQDQSQIPGFVSLGEAAGREYVQSLSAAEKLNELIEENGGQTLFFQTWGRRNGDVRNPVLFPDFLTMQAHITEGYQKYWQATTTDARPTYLAPAGLVFQTIYKDIQQTGKDPTDSGSLFHQLYVEDGSHPSLAGSYAAALTIYATITGKHPKEAGWFPPSMEKTVCNQIQDAVNRTIQRTYASHTIEYPWALIPWPNHDTLAEEL